MIFSENICIAADFHLSENHFKYLEKPFSFFVEHIQKTNPLITVISGDYFDSRVNADEDIYHFGIKHILNLCQHSKYVIIIEGTFSHDYNTLDILQTYEKYIDNLFFIKHKQTLLLDNLKILCLPEEYPSDKIGYYKESFEDTYDFVFGHGDIEGALLHSGADNSMLKGFKFNKETLSNMGKAVVFGHYHKHQFLKENLLYCGSLARFKFGEEEEKGFISISDIREKKPIISFVKTPSLALDTIIVDENLNIDEILAKYGVEDEVKIKIPKIEGLKSDLLEKIHAANGIAKLKIDFLKDVSDKDVGFLEYKEIETLSTLEQYVLMLDKEIENKKITKKSQKFFNSDMIKEKLDLILNTTTEEDEIDTSINEEPISQPELNTEKKYTY